jgi:hypothetical protein
MVPVLEELYWTVTVSLPGIFGSRLAAYHLSSSGRP